VPLQKITPFLWFDTQAEEAMEFYLSVFPKAKRLGVTRYGDTGPGSPGSVMVCAFELDGQAFTALNAGPMFKFTEAISFVIDCGDQAEVDYFWTKLTADGGQPGQCGWLKDRFGLSWQVTPRRLIDLISSSDRALSNRVMQAMMGMTRIDIAELEAAAKG
jgi:predicted 3-demethylubiquinone-9 3-methyltransferase (glyoxalase superfamily)